MSLGKQKDLKAVKNHIKENLAPVYNGRRCVDGRYQTGQADGAIARPGADLGYILILLALNKQKNLGLSAVQCAKIVFDVLTKDSGKFYMHTDEHAKHNHPPLIGCGHMVKAANPEFVSDYGVNPEDVVAALNEIKKLSQSNPVKFEIITLSGDHNEQGVLVVGGVKNTVNQYNPAGSQKSSYFVYDATRDMEFIEKLVPALGIKGLSVQDFKETSDRQLGATLDLLAKGKPRFDINMDNLKSKIIYTGIV